MFFYTLMLRNNGVNEKAVARMIRIKKPAEAGFLSVFLTHVRLANDAGHLLGDIWVCVQACHHTSVFVGEGFVVHQFTKDVADT